jgi:hypothetical protein
MWCHVTRGGEKATGVGAKYNTHDIAKEYLFETRKEQEQEEKRRGDEHVICARALGCMINYG